jgi:hypothetical protein
MDETAEMTRMDEIEDAKSDYTADFAFLFEGNE